MSGKDLRKLTRISKSMSEHLWERSGFGRSCLSTLRKGLPKELYEEELAALERLYATRSKTSKTDAPPSSDD